MAICYGLPSATPERAPVGRRLPRHVLNEDVFRSALIRERKRADRSHRHLQLVRLELSRDPGPDGSGAWAAAIDSVVAATDETDVLGWLEPGVALGVLLSDVPASEVVGPPGAVAARIGGELGARLQPGAVAQFSVRVHAYPGRDGQDGPSGGVRDPIFNPELSSRGRRGWNYDGIKRAVDLVGSLFLLVALSPLLALIAVLVTLGSPGPVFFRQPRIGHMMKRFTMLKFRTMQVDADPKLHQEFVSRFIRSSGKVDEPGATLFKLTGDPRVTPIGRLLRKTSLDELPQLWNVLRGEMSLIGPRPPLPYELVEYKLWHRRRLVEAKPGITGLWQVAGRSRTTFDEMVRLDLRYARGRSFWTDIKILLATPAAVISGKGAC